MIYTHTLRPSVAATIKEVFPDAVPLPAKGKWKALGLSISDTILVDLSETLPYNITSFLSLKLFFIAFYDKRSNPYIPPFLHYGSAICIPYEVSKEELLAAYESLMAMRKGDECLESLLVGSSTIMRHTRERIMMAASCRFPVHIDGETGTGKDVAAKAIHSLRLPNTAFAYGNGADFASTLGESKLYGHRKGAFTGAVEGNAGLLSEANNTTLILDELENMPLDAQPMFLHVLDTGEYRPLGRSEMAKTEFFLITLSNIPLKRLVEQNRLREDLYYRISCFEIRMPSLWEHPEDIPELIRFYEAVNGFHPNDRIRDYAPFMNSYYEGNNRELNRDVGKYHSEHM